MDRVSTPPLITTIIPTHRRPWLLQRAVRSVLGQTYPNFQVCIYDNASGDETFSVVAALAEADPRVKYYCHSENVGAHENFTLGMKRVNTQFFSILSDDDLLLPDFYETALEGFTKFPDAMFSACTTLVADNESIPSAHPPLIKKGKILAAFPRCVKGNGYYCPPEGLFEIIQDQLIWTGVLFRKEVVDEVGLLDANVGALSEQDYLFRIASRFPFVVSRESCAIFVDHKHAHSHSRHLENLWPYWLDMVAKLTGDDRISPDVQVRAERALVKKLQKLLFFYGIRAATQKEFGETREIADILRNRYHLRTKSFLLCLTAASCQHLPLAYISLVYLYRIFFLTRSLVMLGKYNKKLEQYS